MFVAYSVYFMGIYIYNLQSVMENPDAPPVLVTQIAAYQKNFFWVSKLVEDSQTKAAALATVQEMEKKLQEVSKHFSYFLTLGYKYMF